MIGRFCFEAVPTARGFIICSGIGHWIAAWTLVCAASASATVTDPADPGPYPAGNLSVAIPGTGGATLAADLYYPGLEGLIDPAAGSCPVILLAHGFSQSKERHVNQGLHLASRGYLVLIPNSNVASDHSRFADDLSRCIDWIEERNGDPESLLHRRVRVDRVGATGNSAGGLSAILAASRDARIRALSPMDPVDNGGLGAAALGSVEAPTALTWSEPSSCNANGSSALLYEFATGPRRGLRIVGANHSDPQDPAGFLSILVCGRPNSARQRLYRRYMTGWFDYHLRDDARYAPWVFVDEPGPAREDLQAGRIEWRETADPAAAWRFVHFGPDARDETVAGDLVDADGDGFPNLLEYAFNTDPKDPASRPKITVATMKGDDGGIHQALTFPRVSRAADLVYRVDASTDLRHWIPLLTLQPGQRPDTLDVFIEGSGLQWVTVRDASPVGPGGGRYLRLSISRLK